MFPEHRIGAGIYTHMIPFNLHHDSRKQVLSMALQDEAWRDCLAWTDCIFPAEGGSDCRCCYHLRSSPFPCLSPLGLPGVSCVPLSATEVLAFWECLGFLPPYDPRLCLPPNSQDCSDDG